jgi:hypothetical protein
MENIACVNLDVAQYIIHDGTLREKLIEWKFILARVCVKYLEIAKWCFANQNLREAFSETDLEEVGIAHLDIAKQVLDDDNLSGKLTGENLIKICDEHPCLEPVVFSQPSLVTKLMTSLRQFQGTSHSISFCEAVVNHIMFSSLDVDLQQHFRVEAATANEFLALLCPERCLLLTEDRAKANSKINNLTARVRSLTF